MLFPDGAPSTKFRNWKFADGPPHALWLVTMQDCRKFCLLTILYAPTFSYGFSGPYPNGENGTRENTHIDLVLWFQMKFLNLSVLLEES